MVRAKFKVEFIEQDKGDPECKTIHLRAVYDSDPNSENGRFFKWTPNGTVVLSTINESAWSQFEEGKEYYVDFTEVN